MSSQLKTISSSIAKLRALLSESRKDLHRIQTLQTTLTEVLDGFWDDDVVEILVGDRSLWKETLTVVASGRVLGVAAQAEEALGLGRGGVGEEVGEGMGRERKWVSSGDEYSRWLARGVVRLSCDGKVSGENEKENYGKAAAQLCGKALSLGYNNAVVETILDQLVLKDNTSVPEFQALIANLTASERKRVLLSTLDIISRRYLSRLQPSFTNQDQGNTQTTPRPLKTISGAAALLTSLTAANATLEDDLTDWLISRPCSNNLARAILATLSDRALLKTMNTTWAHFGDKLRLKHTSILQQESTVQILLMTAGYVHRRVAPAEVLAKARSSTHATGISSRLGSSSSRLRFLAMVVGVAISRLVDKLENRMVFESEEMDGEEGRWYLGLVEVDDRVGEIEDLSRTKNSPMMMTTATTTVEKIKKQSGKVQAAVLAAKPMITEVLDDDNDDDDDDADLAVYEKPDSDPEDSDEDPTLIERKKPKPPVYIRDLITSLHNTTNYPIHHIALLSAAPLIRRKATFGTELSDRAEELASVLTGLADVFAMENWHELRQEAMVASVVAAPKLLAGWFVRGFFGGDWSLSQRAGMLVTLGLAARELAGLGKVDGDGAGMEQKQQFANATSSFPSKRLPERLHNLYAETAEVNALARRLEQTMLQPVMTNTTTKTKLKSRTTRNIAVKNQLAGIVAECFFFPLTGYWQAFSQTSKFLTTPPLLPLYLKTVSIILSSAGPSTLSLPRMTSEYWSLLLSLRTAALNDATVLEAVLFGFLTILNVNEDRQRLLVQECAGEVVETREWVGGVWERLEEGGGGGGLGLGWVRAGGGGGAAVGAGQEEEGESERCKVLAAGVLVALKEMIDRYERLMAGSFVMM